MKLGGVIYLLNIAENRMKGTTLRNLDMFSQLCGDNAFARIVLGTTNWGEIDKDVGEKHERQLDKTFWSIMTSLGSKSLRFEQTHASALVFLDAILNKLEFGADEVSLNGSTNITISSTTHMENFKSRAFSRSKNRDRIIKTTGDSVMVDGRSTDIVIP
jgi:hypothetical protein